MRPTTRDTTYEPMGFGLLRSPLLPIDDLLEHLDRPAADAARELAGTDPRGVFGTALFISSMDLHASLGGGPTRPDGPAARRRYSSLYRFLARASSRPTPYGAFAGVALVEVGEGTSLLRAPEPFALHVRPDASWLLGLRAAIIGDEHLRAGLPLRVNPQILIHGGRLLLPNADVAGRVDDRSVDMRFTAAVRRTIEACSAGTTRDGLVDAVASPASAWPRASVEQLVDTLLELNVLVHDVLPAVGQPDIWRAWRERFAGLPLGRALDELHRAMSGISHLDDHTVDRLEGVFAQQDAVTAGDFRDRVQVDAEVRLSEARIGSAVVEEVGDCLTVLAALVPSPRPPHLQEFHERCVERYGVHAEVAVKELLSEDAGVGPPNEYAVPRASTWHPVASTREPSRWEQVSSRAVADALLAGDREVVVDDDLVSLVGRDATPGRPSSPLVDAYVQIEADSAEAVDAGRWRAVLGSDGTAEGGRTFGRFLHLLDASAAARISGAYARTHPSSDCMVAELRYLPTTGRAANVTVVPPLVDHEIAVNVAETGGDVRAIALDDILVGFADERFYLRVRGEARELRVVQTHMLNHYAAPNAVRFLLEATQDSTAGVPSLDLHHLDHLRHVPRFVRGRVVLRAARWRIDRVDDVVPDAHLAAWRTRHRVPRHVYISDSDNRLLIDLESDVGRDELVRAVEQQGRAGSAVMLEECLPAPQGMLLSDVRGRRYASELVLPFIRRDGAHAPVVVAADARVRRDALAPAPQDRQAWLSAKLYAAFRRHEDLLVRVVRPMLDAVGSPDWFFVEYADPYPHLRVRIRRTAEAAHAHAELVSAVMGALEDARAAGQLSRFEIVEYDRENERYGGPDLISHAETLFSRSSDLIVHALVAMRSGAVGCSRDQLCLLGLDAILQGWEEHGDAERALAVGAVSSGTRKRFHEEGRDLAELLAPWRSGHDAAVTTTRRMLGPGLSRLRSAAADYRAAADEAAGEGRLIGDLDHMLRSVLHMQCNRTLTGGRDEETEVMDLWALTRRAISRRPSATGSR
ncbi:lantibiotic dehydratase [Clavibacter sp. CFBP 8614]|uniref:lantibiotic dehydratase n=1 Tax=unclassified Clavibacter TaxID=2626594 RepID=UPI0040422D77